MNKKTISIIIIAVAVIAAGLWVAFGQKQTASTPAHGNESTANKGAAAGAAATITYTNDGFSPKTVTVKSGDTVNVVNNSSTELEFSSNDHPTHLNDPELNMTTLEPGKSGSITPIKTGTMGYHNHLKASDTGTLTVE
jgi:plastocyanin